MMETNWNQLIERYMQNELSEEGRDAFEYELQNNEELKMEFDIHLMLQAGVIRSVERTEIAAIGKKYHFRKKMNQWAITAGVVAVAAAVSLFVLGNRGKHHVKIGEIKGLSMEIIPEGTISHIDTVFSNEHSTFYSITYSHNSETAAEPLIQFPEVKTTKGSATKDSLATEKKEKPEKPRLITVNHGVDGVKVKSRYRNDSDLGEFGETVENMRVFTVGNELHILNTETNEIFVINISNKHEGNVKHTYWFYEFVHRSDRKSNKTPQPTEEEKQPQ